MNYEDMFELDVALAPSYLSSTVHFCFLWRYCARISCLILQVSPNQTGFPQRNSPFPTAPVTSYTHRSPEHRPKSAQPPFEFHTTAVPNQQQSRAVVLVIGELQRKGKLYCHSVSRRCFHLTRGAVSRWLYQISRSTYYCYIPYIDREILCSPSLKAHLTRLLVCFYLWWTFDQQSYHLHYFKGIKVLFCI